MKILVTGHLGFVGTETCKMLTEKYQAHVIGYDLMQGKDIRDRSQLELTCQCEKPDAILHLAAIARFADADNDPILANDINVNGTRTVITVADKLHIPVVYASTGSAIMPLDQYQAPYKEIIPARGNSVYGCTKAMAEYVVIQHTPHIILRYAHIYGREKRGHGLIGGFIQRIERGLQPVLYGGRQTNDFTYINDIAQANCLALMSSWDKWNQTYHIGSGEELSAKKAGEILCNKLGWDGGMKIDDARTVDAGRFIFDISKARMWLGYEPKYTFEAGLEDMLP